MMVRYLPTAMVATVIAAVATAGPALPDAAKSGGATAGVAGILLAQAAGYDPMRRAAPAPDAAERPPDDPELDGLVDAPGAEDVFYTCSACHSVALVRQQRLSDARWDYLWNWMIEEQGMADGGEELRATILDYLKQYYSSER